MAVHAIRRALRKPPRVIAFRAFQEFRLAVMRYGQAWPRLERSIARWWSTARLQDYAAVGRTRPGSIAADAPEALQTAVRDGWLDAHVLHAFGQRMRDREFALLGAPVPRQGALPWHSDWRWDYTWQPTYFRSYDFYIPDSPVPYDVKVPWELSRLGFILPILQNAVLDPQGDWIEAALSPIADWEKHNPLAYTVGWYPMEAAMRSINLVLALDMCLVLGAVQPGVLAPLLRLVTAHGTFIWRTLEYTDIRGNHYMAQLIALLLCGHALHAWYPEAQKWFDYACQSIPPEITQQFLPDGVNFEKSIPYHRLVTELCLVGIMVMQKAGLAVETATRARIHAACHYTAMYTRPDGLSPNVGDNDNARVLGLDACPVRDHAPLVGVGAAVFDDAALKAAAGTLPAALVWLLGTHGITTWNRLSTAQQPTTQYFQEGGAVVARHRENFLWVDVGEVGLAGRGGHGHNDLLSFELFLQGRPVIVDPGCSVYTGDPTLRDLFRSTAYHNGLRVDGTEIAPMSGMWRIANQARPHDIMVATQGTVITVRASHDGYGRLPDPVVHTRELRFDMPASVMTCTDHLACAGRHAAERYLHLDSAIDVVIKGNEAYLAADDQGWVVRWEEETEARVEPGWVSPEYGMQQEAPILVLTNVVTGKTTLSFAIAPYGRL